MTIINHIINSQVSILSIAVEVATIWGFLYALPNFIKQMRATNFSSIAGKILELFPRLEQITLKLLHSIESERKKTIHELGELYAQLWGLLKLLSSESDIQELLDQVKLRLDILKKINSHNENDVMQDFLINEFGPEWYSRRKEQEIKLPLINHEKILRKIYENPQVSWISDFCTFTGWVLMLYALRVFIPNFENSLLLTLIIFYFLYRFMSAFHPVRRGS
jgi:hypothetical protein